MYLFHTQYYPFGEIGADVSICQQSLHDRPAKMNQFQQAALTVNSLDCMNWVNTVSSLCRGLAQSFDVASRSGLAASHQPLGLFGGGEGGGGGRLSAAQPACVVPCGWGCLLQRAINNV